MPPQNLLYRALQVVVAQHPEHAAKIGERQFVSLQKCLLTCMRIGAVKCSAAGHAPHAEDIEFVLFTVQLRVGFIPIHLCFLTPPVRLGDEDLASDKPQLKLALAYVPSNCRLAHINTGHLLTQTAPDPMSRMPLFARSSLIRFKNRIYEWLCRFEFVSVLDGPLAFLWDGAGQGFSHHPPVNSQFFRHPVDCSHSMFILPPHLLE